jgi:hypothetical protein
MVLLVLWAGLLIFAFAMIYHGLGDRFQADRGSIGFGALLYMSGSTFFTLGLGDITSTDPLARFYMILETGTGYIFLALIITYMPVLHQAYGAREVDNLLIHARAGHPRGAIKLLRRYPGVDLSEILRANLREAERWMAETLQSHRSHPVLAFYRGHHWGQSWLVSLTTLLDSSALLIGSGDSLLAAQARFTYLMGLRLLKDLTHDLGIAVDPRCRIRLTEADLPTIPERLKVSGISLNLGPAASNRLIRLVRRYDVYLFALSKSLVIPLPPWMSTIFGGREARASEES